MSIYFGISQLAMELHQDIQVTRRLAAHPHLNIWACLKLRAPLRIMPSTTKPNRIK